MNALYLCWRASDKEKYVQKEGEREEALHNVALQKDIPLCFRLLHTLFSFSPRLNGAELSDRLPNPP